MDINYIYYVIVLQKRIKNVVSGDKIIETK
jgi:hypothetical protein